MAKTNEEQEIEISHSKHEHAHEWSYDAPARFMNSDRQLLDTSKDTSITMTPVVSKHNKPQHTIFAILKHHEFSPNPVTAIGDPHDDDDDGTSSYDYELDIGKYSSDEDSDESSENSDSNTSQSESSSPIQGTTNGSKLANDNMHIIAALLLLLFSAVALIFFEWTMEHTALVNYEVMQLVLYQGTVQIVLCVFIAVGFSAVASVKNIQFANKGMRRNASFRTLMLPFSMDYNVDFVRFLKRSSSKKQLQIQKHDVHLTDSQYGAITLDDDSCQKKQKSKLFKMVLCIVFVGVFGALSQIIYLNQIKAKGAEEMASLPFECMSVFTVVLTIVWAYLIYGVSLNFQMYLYLFTSVIGVILIIYSSLANYDFSTNNGINNKVLYSLIGFLFFCALLNSFVFILIRAAKRAPTFTIVFCQAIFVSIFAAVIMKTSPPPKHASSVNALSVSHIPYIIMLGFTGFVVSWSFVRGTQLICVSMASYYSIAFFMTFAFVLNHYNMLSMYNIAGVALILFSMVLVLIEMFSKSRRSQRKRLLSN